VIIRQQLPAVRGMGDVATDTWPSTGAIDTETQSLALSISQLGTDIFNSNTPDSDAYTTLQNAWNTFVADFTQWQNAAWFWNPSRRDELVSYRARYNALLAQWQSLPGVVTAATPVANATPPASPLDTVLAIAGDLVWVAAIGAAVWVGSTIYKEIRRP
jgi:hypothetical protein